MTVSVSLLELFRQLHGPDRPAGMVDCGLPFVEGKRIRQNLADATENYLLALRKQRQLELRVNRTKEQVQLNAARQAVMDAVDQVEIAYDGRQTRKVQQ